MRIKIPEFKEKKDLFAYLKQNKAQLIAQKSSMPIYSEANSFPITKINVKTTVSKSNEPVNEDLDVLKIKVVANTALWLDSHMDVLLPDCWEKSINERKHLIPHLHDHIHKIDAKIGEVADIYSSNLSFSELGIKGTGTTQALIFETDVIKFYNEKVFNQYKMGKINQHSIGLRYIKLDLAINDEDSEKEMEFWNKYIGQIINPEIALERGYFWVVQEIKLLENSAVLFGSNEITPTLDNNVKNIEPSQDTHKSEPSQDTQFSVMNAINNVKPKI
ncbi:hypothetical protein PL373_16810 [Tenacibaculum maritimum]|nr:hypothetical protein [Tenacibaculum maritimum]MDB0602757.1 hypothetical protein [Tenacibaculum maritimum]MDB0612359.1 hypothetical protein [Tenacibaculum maritimum]